MCMQADVHYVCPSTPTIQLLRVSLHTRHPLLATIDQACTLHPLYPAPIYALPPCTLHPLYSVSLTLHPATPCTLYALQASKDVSSSWDTWRSPPVPRGDLQTTLVFKGFDEVRACMGF